MTVWQLLGLIFLAGGLGGLMNSFLNDKGLILPHSVPKGDGTNILLPGFIGNIIVGSTASTVSWLLYGPISQLGITLSSASITLAALGSAVMVGMTGSGWLNNAIDKNVMRAAAANAAIGSSDPIAAREMLQAQPLDAFKIAQGMSGVSDSCAPLSTYTNTTSPTTTTIPEVPSPSLTSTPISSNTRIQE